MLVYIYIYHQWYQPFMNWTFFPRCSRSAADSHLAPCWGQRRALVRLRPPQRDAADASLAGHLSSGACLVKQSHSQNIQYGKKMQKVQLPSGDIWGWFIPPNLWWFWVVFFLWFTTLLAKNMGSHEKIQGVAPMLCTCFVFWSYLALALGGNGFKGRWKF